MKAEIISIGTEILLGEITDTNANFLAGQLPSLGIGLYFISAVGDNRQRLIDLLQQAWQRSDLIITTGGLCPTQDDVTREAIAEFLHEDLSVDSNLVQKLQDFFSHRKIEMPPSNIKQATVIPSAQTLSNLKGTAPGWWIERNGRIIIAMPGPPREMQLMWTEEVLDKLKQKLDSSVIISKTLKTFGLSEATVDELVGSLLQTCNPTLATYAKTDGIYLRITAEAQQRSDAEALIAQREADVRAILDDYIWGTDPESLEGIMGALLTAKGLTIATMESETGGSLANIITNIPESSTYYRGGLIACSDKAKIAFGIDDEFISQYSPISAEMAEAMATIVRDKLRSDIGVGITAAISSSEPEDRSAGNIFIGIDDGKTRHRFCRYYPGRRFQIKQRAIASTLFELNKILTQGENYAPHHRRLWKR